MDGGIYLDGWMDGWVAAAREAPPSPRSGENPEPAEEEGKEEGYLVDPASSHMLVSKIKPCMCKYKLVCTVKLRMAH